MLPGEPTSLPPDAIDKILLDFLAERFRGTRPIAWGRQLQELWITAGVYAGVLGVDSLAHGSQPRGAGDEQAVAEEGEMVDAER